MKVVLTGGGSGGHITPLLAVAHELKQLKPDVDIAYIGLRGDSLADIPASHPDIDVAYAVRAGKFRRYHGQGIKQVLDVVTVVKNMRDAGRVVKGLSESYRLLKRLRPDIIFINGGEVGVPVGLAAARLKIPFITHDSDAVPGLANRIIARWAKIHAVAQSAEVYDYPLETTITVGVPIADDYMHIDNNQQQLLKKEIGLPKNTKLILITGGGLGAQRLNDAVVHIAKRLLTNHPEIILVQASGRKHESYLNKAYDALLLNEQRERVVVKGYIEDFYRYSGAADIIVARAGATNIAEFAVQGKACIIVPNPHLTKGHQLKNAQILADADAVELFKDEDLAQPENLLLNIDKLLNDEPRRIQLGQNLHTFAHPDASKKLAQLIINAAIKT